VVGMGGWLESVESRGAELGGALIALLKGFQ